MYEKLGILVKEEIEKNPEFLEKLGNDPNLAIRGLIGDEYPGLNFKISDEGEIIAYNPNDNKKENLSDEELDEVTGGVSQVAKGGIAILSLVTMGLSTAPAVFASGNVDTMSPTTSISTTVKSKSNSIRSRFGFLKREDQGEKNIGKSIISKFAGTVGKVGAEVISIAGTDAQQKVNDKLKFLINDAGGFVYDKEKNVYHTREDALQKYFGFGDVYDELGPLGGMNIDEAPIVFRAKDANGKETEWLVELWKGQYGGGTASGGEIGIYNREVTDGMREYKVGEKNYKILFKSATGANKMRMSYTLYDKNTNKEIFSRNSSEYEKPAGEEQDKDWWLLGIRVGEHHNKEDMKMRATIEFLDEDMAQAFKEAAQKQGGGKISDIQVSGSQVSLMWGA